MRLIYSLNTSTFGKVLLYSSCGASFSYVVNTLDLLFWFL
ncbi:hypothetical protein D1BOALGB6SA_8105 [Olavius sp. associated proteobacterium Delta 1]|nr:hypothetical protein D1BOALGB6SA_8105 [Olavius sp. associated proteobacterium Delta 1]